MRIIHLALALTLPLFAADKPKPAAPFKNLKPATPEGFTLKTLLVEAHPEHNVELYVYVPDADVIEPCILDIHGGGWKSRQVENDKPMMERLAQRGFVTALVSYRLSGKPSIPPLCPIAKQPYAV